MKVRIHPGLNENHVMLLCVMLYSFHVVRNIYSLYSFVPFCLSLFFIIALMLLRVRRTLSPVSLLVAIFYLVYTLVVLINSLVWFPDLSYGYALSRYVFMFPFMFLVILIVNQESYFVECMKFISFFIVLAGLSVLFQVITHHPIHWFNDSSYRFGHVRYASLAGSLTVYGVVGGYGLLIVCYLFNQHWMKVLFSAVIIAGMLFTFQKAAVINILLAIFLMLRNKSLLKMILVFMFTAFVCFVLMKFGPHYVQLSLRNIFDHSMVTTSDAPILPSITQRLWELPSVLYHKYGMLGMITGVGFVGGSGSLGLPDFPMAHNSVFYLLFVGGIPYFISFILVSSLFFVSVHKCKKSSVYSKKTVEFSCNLMIMILINSLFSTIPYLQPYSAMIYYLIVFFFLRVLTRRCSPPLVTADR